MRNTRNNERSTFFVFLNARPNSRNFADLQFAGHALCRDGVFPYLCVEMEYFPISGDQDSRFRSRRGTDHQEVVGAARASDRQRPFCPL
jgi:hypothetical protein